MFDSHSLQNAFLLLSLSLRHSTTFFPWCDRPSDGSTLRIDQVVFHTVSLGFKEFLHSLLLSIALIIRRPFPFELFAA
jgi:hypothetical protein